MTKTEISVKIISIVNVQWQLFCPTFGFICNCEVREIVLQDFDPH